MIARWCTDKGCCWSYGGHEAESCNSNVKRSHCGICNIGDVRSSRQVR